MTISNKIRDQKMQYDINRKAEKISASSSGKEILQVKKYCLLIKEESQKKLSLHILLQEKLYKKTKAIEYQGKKQTKATEDNEKQLVESSIDRDSIPLVEHKKCLINLLKKSLLNLEIQKKEVILMI